jgi:hypothetical protein
MGYKVIGKGTIARVGSSKSFLMGAPDRGRRYYKNTAACKHTNIARFFFLSNRVFYIV